jgi:hypothetical protein
MPSPSLKMPSCPAMAAGVRVISRDQQHAYAGSVERLGGRGRGSAQWVTDPDRAQRTQVAWIAWITCFRTVPGRDRHDAQPLRCQLGCGPAQLVQVVFVGGGDRRDQHGLRRALADGVVALGGLMDRRHPAGLLIERMLGGPWDGVSLRLRVQTAAASERHQSGLRLRHHDPGRLISRAVHLVLGAARDGPAYRHPALRQGPGLVRGDNGHRAERLDRMQVARDRLMPGDPPGSERRRQRHDRRQRLRYGGNHEAYRHQRHRHHGPAGEDADHRHEEAHRDDRRPSVRPGACIKVDQSHSSISAERVIQSIIMRFGRSRAS